MPVIERGGVDGADRSIVVLGAPRERALLRPAHGPGADAKRSDLKIAVSQLPSSA